MLASIAALTAACGSSTLATPTPSIDTREVRISAEAAIAAVKAFVPDASQLTVEGPQDSVYHRFYQVDGPGLAAGVDAFDGRVMSLTLLDLMPASNSVVLSPDEAQARGTQYLAEHHISTEGLTATVRLVPHGDFSEIRG